jgi:hypothetical protein
MKPAFLISMFGAQAIVVPAGFGSSGLAIGAQIANPIHSERSCLRLADAYELAGKGSRRACSRDTIGCEWSQASARATAFAANSPFPYAHRNDWSPPNLGVQGRGLLCPQYVDSGHPLCVGSRHAITCDQNA